MDNKTNVLFFPRAFEGLTEKEIVSIYNIGSIRNIDTGDVLFKGGDTDQTMFLMLKGSLKIAQRPDGQSREIATYSEGDWVREPVPGRRTDRYTTVLASEPSTVLVLDETSLNALSPQIKSAIYQNLNTATRQRINHLVKKEAELSCKNRQLTCYIRNALETKKGGYCHSEIIQSILKNVPRLPMYATNLATRLLDQNLSIREAADLTKADPSLAGAVLKSINSGYYNLKNKVSDIHHAVMLLGFHQVYQLVMADEMRKTMPDSPEFQELHAHCLVVSHIAFEICQLYDVQKAPLLSTIGLVHDLGKSIVLLLKNKYPRLDMLVDTLDHAKIGSLLLKEWNIPDLVGRSVEYQHYPEFCPPSEIPPEYRHTVAILYVAHLCYEYLRGKKEGELQGAFINEYMQFINFSNKSLAELVKKHLLPSLSKKKHALPEPVLHFLKEDKRR